MLTTRLGMLLTRLGEVWTTLPCPGCRAPMACREDVPLGGQPQTVERVYQCRACGNRVTRYWLMAIPD
jgi:hypothetical protein